MHTQIKDEYCVCKVCHKELPLAEFWRGNSSYCKYCSRIRSKEYKESKRKLLYQHLVSHPCIDCGESDVLLLEFDHVRGGKLKDVSAMVGQMAPDDKIKKEIAKCDVRCRNCHRKSTIRKSNQMPWLYNKELIINSVIMVMRRPPRRGYIKEYRQDGSKRCRNCLKFKMKTDFYADYKNQCKKCFLRRGQAGTLMKNLYVFNYLCMNPCIDCGETDVRVLEFDHFIDKTEAIGTMKAKNRSLDAIKREIAKCDVRCANCHRLKTIKQFDQLNWLAAWLEESRSNANK